MGDVFGAPLAMEGLLAFFLESTFLGLWIFGWDRLPKKVHLATIWTAATGNVLSAYFILAANSWMQYPVGYTVNEAAGRAELTDIVPVLTSPMALVTFVHTIPAAFMTGGAFVAGVASWRLLRHPDTDRPAFRTAAKVGAWMVVVSGLLVAVSGDIQARVMTDAQPMKMASAEATRRGSPTRRSGGVGPAPADMFCVHTRHVFGLSRPIGLWYSYRAFLFGGGSMAKSS